MTISAGSPFTPMDPHGHDTFDCTKTKAGGLISPSWPRGRPRKIRDVAVGWDGPTAATPWLLSGCRYPLVI